VQLVWPEIAWNVPAAHPVHALADAAEYWPAGQGADTAESPTDAQ